MGREEFRKEKLKILCYMVVYDLLFEVVSLFVSGPDWRIPLGLLIGTCTSAVNLSALEKVVDCAIEGKHVRLAFLLHLGRFFLFGAAGWICSLISLRTLVAYGIGVLGLAVSSACVYLHRGSCREQEQVSDS